MQENIVIASTDNTQPWEIWRQDGSVPRFCGATARRRDAECVRKALARVWPPESITIRYVGKKLGINGDGWGGA